ncbi:UPF0175 family protein [uncultured Thiodictyon sp.]|uniref:UPF0175 family protein n=1 Tax=uncultured Thiodictyon sp. TaxID=1846217 RepID=UPI0025D468BA|nr:UPF0175 family protein [uncultured Thiodictyon sp.]
MVHIAFDIQEGALSSVRHNPEMFTRELRIAAAVKWYEIKQVSQGRAAEIAGLSRSELEQVAQAIEADAGEAIPGLRESLAEMAADVDLEDLCLAEERLIESRAGRSQSYTLEEVERDLGLAV